MCVCVRACVCAHVCVCVHTCVCVCASVFVCECTKIIQRTVAHYTHQESQHMHVNVEVRVDSTVKYTLVC